MPTNLPPRRTQIGTCPSCGKYNYASRRDAKRAGRAFHPAGLMRAYRCGQFWHVTSAARAWWRWA